METIGEPTEIILVRHGQTEWNVIHKLQGQGNSELTSAGLSGAKKAGTKLYSMHQRGRRISAVYASPLKRAAETARIIMEQFRNYDDDLQIQYDDRLKERHFGDFQGLTYAQVREKNDLVFSAIDQKPPGKGGESRLDVYNRAMECLAEITMENAGKRVLVVTHGGIAYIDGDGRCIYDVGVLCKQECCRRL